MQPKHGSDRRGQQTPVTRETVEEMIAAAFSGVAVLAENDKWRLDQSQKKIAVLEHQRGEALEKVKALENERNEYLVMIQNLRDDLKKALHEVTLAKSKAVAVWESDAGVQLTRKQNELDDVLAVMKAQEAKIIHLESQLAKIHSLSKSDDTVASISVRPDSAHPKDRVAWGSHESLPQTSGWGDLTASNSVDGAADTW